MRFARAFALVSLASVSLVVACVGGPGVINQGSDNGDQNDTITNDPSGSSIAAPPGSGRSTTVSTGGSSTSGAPAKTYQPQPDIKATDYRQDCTQDFDCTPISEGAVCGPLCGCSNAAINRSDATKASTDLFTRRANCDPSTLQGQCAPCNSAGKSAYCDPGTQKCKYDVKPDAG